MFKMKYNQVNSQNFLQALSMLGGERLPTKIAYEVKKMTDSVLTARREIRESYMKDIVKKFALLDEKEEVQFEKDANGKPDMTAIIIKDGEKDNFNKAVDEFGEREYSFKRQKLFMESLQTIEMTAAQLSALDPILTELSLVGKSEEVA